MPESKEPATVDSIFDNVGSLTWRQVVALILIALARFNMGINFITDVIITRDSNFTCTLNGTNETRVNSCPGDKVKNCDTLVFEEATLVSEFSLVCDG